MIKIIDMAFKVLLIITGITLGMILHGLSN
jgi:hypothetical protein